MHMSHKGFQPHRKMSRMTRQFDFGAKIIIKQNFKSNYM